MNIKSKIVLFGCVLSLMMSCRLNKAYEALEIYNYFEAKKQFEKSLKRSPSPAAYGLSIIYFRNDNPFHNIDSAYHYSLKSIERYDDAKEKKLEKWEEDFNVSKKVLTAHRENISEKMFQLAKDTNTIKSYIDFQARHPWSPLVDSAQFFEEELAFNQANSISSSVSYRNFLKKYPETRFTDTAQEKLERRQFEETIKEGDIDSYSRFVEIFPENRYVEDAQFFIYETVTSDNTIKSFRSFIKNYEESPYINAAWEKYYRLYIADYSKETILSFKNKYPNFPYPDMIESDLLMVEEKLFPVLKNGKFGFMNRQGELIVKAEYDYVSIFSSGLAAVFKNGKFGFIDKNNNVIIDFLFDEVQDFEQGRAVVEIDENFGWINTTGSYVIPAVYEDIGTYSDGIIYGFKDDKYQYFNRDGKPLFDRKFDEAYSFTDGLAKVFFDDYVAYLKKDGSFLIKSEAKDLKHFHENLFVIDFGDSLNITDLNDSLYLEESVDRIGTLNDNRAIYEKDGEFGYLNERGEVIIEAKYNLYPNYFQFAQFTNYHAKVAKGDKFSLIDTLDNKILPAIFDNIGDYGELIPVNRGRGWGYADHNGKLQIRYDYDFAYPFVDKQAIVINNGLSGVINLKNEPVIPIQFVSVKRVTKGSDSTKINFFIVSNESRELFIYNDKGELLTEQPFNRYQKYDENILRLEYETEISYFDVRNLKFITLKSSDG